MKMNKKSKGRHSIAEALKDDTIPCEHHESTTVALCSTRSESQYYCGFQARNPKRASYVVTSSHLADSDGQLRAALSAIAQMLMSSGLNYTLAPQYGDRGPTRTPLRLKSVPISFALRPVTSPHSSPCPRRRTTRLSCSRAQSQTRSRPTSSLPPTNLANHSPRPPTSPSRSHPLRRVYTSSRTLRRDTPRKRAAMTSSTLWLNCG